MVTNTAGVTFTTIDNASGVREDYIPNNVRDLLSSTSYAPECFINQRFSGNLQAFLVGYVNSVYSEYSVAE